MTLCIAYNLFYVFRDITKSMRQVGTRYYKVLQRRLKHRREA